MPPFVETPLEIIEATPADPSSQSVAVNDSSSTEGVDNDGGNTGLGDTASEASGEGESEGEAGEGEGGGSGGSGGG